MDQEHIEKQTDLERIMESAKRIGVEINEEEARQWLARMTASKNENTIITSNRDGMFGHKLTMLDYSETELAYFKRIGKIIEFEDIPNKVETALALSSSSAKSKIQAYPGDCDYFERINILAPTYESACQIFSGIMREKALKTRQGENFQLIEIAYGSYPEDLLIGKKSVKAGTPIIWKPEQVEAGKIDGFRQDGSSITITWDQVSDDPGWCKLDWVVADPIHKQLANASNMLDVTWEAPDGKITPLDGYLDPYFQEIYLDSSSIPIFSKLAQHASANALEDYVQQLEYEVQKYLTNEINYGKVAKRMYNIFRLTGRFEEASFLRELFDEPANMLYQTWSLIQTIDDASEPGSTITREQLVHSTDKLIIEVVQALEGEEESEIVSQLLNLRDAVSNSNERENLSIEADAARSKIINLINNFYYNRLIAMPTIKEYINHFQMR